MFRGISRKELGCLRLSSVIPAQPGEDIGAVVRRGVLMAEKGDAGDADDAADEEGDGVRLVEHVQRDLVHLAVIHRPACASSVALSQSKLLIKKRNSTSSDIAGISLEDSSCYCGCLIPEVSGQRLRLRGGRHPRLRQHSPRRGLGPRTHGKWLVRL